MATHILIGIGGTGAKVVEAVTHLAAAGVAGRALTIGLIDQDSANGNVRRALATVETYRGVRAAWTGDGLEDRLEMTGDPGSTPFRTQIDLLSEEPFIPQPQANSRLRSMLRVAPDEEALFDLLYEPGPSEQELVLDEGYRGRPHIGAAAITHAVENERQRFWAELEARIRDAKGDEVRLILAGSVFGGTGAAGFPTVARLIRSKVKALGVGRNVRIGGVLMLPYFTFEHPENDDANVARPEDLMPQTRDALNHYVNLLESEHLFDSLYLVGWDDPVKLDYFEPGNAAQRNPAMLPEFIAAHGVCRFLVEEPHEGHEGEDAAVFVSARARHDRLSWDDLGPIAGVDVQQRFGQLLRFAIAWKHYRRTLETPPGFLKSIISGKGALGAQNPPNRVPRERFDRTSRYVDLLLAWAAEAERYGGGAHLWTVQPVLLPSPQGSRPSDAPLVRDEIDDDVFTAAFNGAAGPATHNAAGLQDRLSREKASGGHSGHGVALAALYQFAA